MEDYSDLLLSITEPIDKEKRKPIESDIKSSREENENKIKTLTAEQEEKVFFQNMISMFTPEKQMRETRIKGVSYFDILGKKYLIRRPYNEPNWAIYENGSFLVRIIMEDKDSYLFKVDSKTLSCLNLSDILTEKIKKEMDLKGDYCWFILNYRESNEILNDFCNISKSKRNTII